MVLHVLRMVSLLKNYGSERVKSIIVGKASEDTKDTKIITTGANASFEKAFLDAALYGMGRS